MWSLFWGRVAPEPVAIVATPLPSAAAETATIESAFDAAIIAADEPPPAVPLMLIARLVQREPQAAAAYAPLTAACEEGADFFTMRDAVIALFGAQGVAPDGQLGVQRIGGGGGDLVMWYPLSAPLQQSVILTSHRGGRFYSATDFMESDGEQQQQQVPWPWPPQQPAGFLPPQPVVDVTPVTLNIAQQQQQQPHKRQRRAPKNRDM